MSTGYHAESFAREKTLSPLANYLKKLLPSKERQRRGRDGVRGMIANLKARQERMNGSR